VKGDKGGLGPTGLMGPEGPEGPKVDIYLILCPTNLSNFFRDLKAQEEKLDPQVLQGK
jgi:hypothetical protein